MRLLISIVGALLVHPWVATAAAQTPATTAFVDVSVVPMDRERVLSRQTVVVRGNRIAAMGPVGKVSIPAAAVRVDGRGKYLIPGLADMHIHLGWNPGDELMNRQMLFRQVAQGVTTVRDMGGKLPTLALKAQAESGAILSPRLYVSVRPGSEGLNDLSTRPDSAVRLAQRAGFDLIKFWSAPDGEELDSILAVARRIGMPIAGHAPKVCRDGRCDNENRSAIRMGYASVEHLIGFWDASDDEIRAVGTALKQADVWVCPTLFHVVNEFKRPLAEKKIDLYHVVKVLHEAGAGLLLGNDYGPTPGHMASDELAAFVQAGLTPYEALLTGTRNVAAYLGTLDSTGTVAVGKRADLVLLAGNPLTDVRHTAEPAGVMLGGRWLPRAELDRIMALLPDIAELLKGGGQ